MAGADEPGQRRGEVAPDGAWFPLDLAWTDDVSGKWRRDSETGQVVISACPRAVGGPMAGDLVVYVSEEGADAERVDMLTGFLRSDLLSLDTADAEVSVLHEGELPPGARSVEVAALGGLLIKLGESSSTVRSIVSAIMRWLDRSPNRGRTVRLELDGDVLVLSEATAQEEARLVDLFVARHAPEEES